MTTTTRPRTWVDLYRIRRDGAAIILPEPVSCRCGRAVVFCVNRDGVTRCVECDAAADKAARGEP